MSKVDRDSIIDFDSWEQNCEVDLLDDSGCSAVNTSSIRRKVAFFVCSFGLLAVGFATGRTGLGLDGKNPLPPSHSNEDDTSILRDEYTIMKPPRPVHLVYSSDEDSMPGVEASIRSVKAHASGPVEFLFVGNKPLKSMPDVRFKELSKVSQKYRLEEFTNPTVKRQGHNNGLNTNHANFVRFVMDSLLPAQSKAMWVDADTIIECDVVELFKNTLVDDDSINVIAAVPRVGAPTGLSGVGRTEFPDIKVSFNAGVYLVDLNRWRSRKMEKKARQIALRNREENLYKMGSQPPLALAVGEDFEHLPQSWNVKMTSVKVVDGAIREEVCLMHWSGPHKPWNGGHEDKIHPEFWLTYGTPNFTPKQKAEKSSHELHE